MAFKQSKLAASNEPILLAQASEPIVISADYNLADSGNGALALNDIIEMVPFPAGYQLVDVIVDTPDLDTGGSPALALDVGVLSGEYRSNSAATMDASIIAASTVGQAGGIARASVAGFSKIAVSDTDRAIGIKAQTGPATGATTGTVRLQATFRPAVNGL